MRSDVSVELGLKFQKELKRLLRKYPCLKGELLRLKDALQMNPKSGQALGGNIYKIRLAIKSKGKGKSDGAGVISHVYTEIVGFIEDNTVTLLTIYDKSEISGVTYEEIALLLNDLLLKND
jgi:hypothetical protein